MTLIVGVLCEDSIVVGADGAATSTTVMGNPTSRQSVKKLTNIGNKIIVGVSGPFGLGQLIVSAVDQLSTTPNVFSVQGTTKRRPEDSMVSLQKAIWAPILDQWKLAKEAEPLVGQASAFQSLISSSVVAVNVHSQPCLFSFDHQGRPEMTKSGLPFVAIGSGQPIAEPFLALLRRIFWPDKCPTYGEGVFAVVWTLMHAIETNPGGVAGPIQILTLKGGTVRELSEGDLGEHKQNIEDAEKALRNYRDSFAKGEQTAPPMPEPPPLSSSV